MKLAHPVGQLRAAAFLEGASLLALVFIAMPLKYVAGQPLAVRVTGSLHGLFFLVFVAALFRVSLERSWPVRRWLTALVWSMVPFGTFVLDRSLRSETDR